MTTPATPAAVTLDDIRQAHERIRSGIYRSPCPPSIPLSDLTGCKIWCKLDLLQRTGSFKERGARNALLLLDAAQRARGVVAASAGNHALGLAYHGKLLGIPVTVVMPRFAPIVKVATCRKLGARVILEGDSFDDARRLAVEMAGRDGLNLVPGFDDARVIAGAVLQGAKQTFTGSRYRGRPGEWTFGRLAIKTAKDTRVLEVGFEAVGGKAVIDAASLRAVRFPSANLLANDELAAVEPVFVEDIRVQFERIPPPLKERLMARSKVSGFVAAATATAITPVKTFSASVYVRNTGDALQFYNHAARLHLMCVQLSS